MFVEMTSIQDRLSHKWNVKLRRVISYDILTKKKYEICTFIAYFAAKRSNSSP